ncbi:MAG: type III-A CRISPR-associated protein Cas10/Csm1 [Magnetococcales bacterium]|nr:type III-A CRISPR-associated protein Cas10/Csm1 [Magnetococcales bacterium]
MNETLLNASCRFALAAMLHDLGKFAERAGLVPPQLDGHKVLYCPVWEGRYSHLHAAHTGLGVDCIEPFLPPIKAGDVAPFGIGQVDDSLINGAGMHHKPETPLQRIIATADRLASGFERSDFENYYNHADEEREEDKGKHVNHRQARQWPILETVNQSGTPVHRLPLQAMSPESLFPVAKREISDSEARQEYAALWGKFVEGMKQIVDQDSWPLWLDHFDTLYLTFTHAIPSATATKKPGGGFMSIPADVSLYDHSKAVAALAVALWRYHEARGTVNEVFCASAWQTWDNHDEQEFLLIQGDFFGIQEFIFSGEGEEAKGAAKLLRGRSFYVSLLTELAALKVLEAFSLPSVCQMTNAAGKFLIVAPNLEDAERRLDAVRLELDRWFLKYTFGQGGIGLAATGASRADFTRTGFGRLTERLFRDLDARKRRRFDLCGATGAPVVFSAFYDHGACPHCGRAPASGDQRGCLLCLDQKDVGARLVKESRLRIGRAIPGEWDLFGYRVGFGEEGVGAVLRDWDFSAPCDGDRPLWNGRARRSINGHVPMRDHALLNFEEIAGSGECGVAALGVLKGDVDDLGLIFQKGLETPTFARMAALSRQLNAFFAVWLPWKCGRDFKNTYTVFAGGDDFFLVGPWLEQIRLAEAMRKEFARYVGGNPALHFCAGLAMAKPGIPVPALAEMAEESLGAAKHHADGKKNAVTCWNRTVSWQKFSRLLAGERELDELVVRLKSEHGVEMSTAYLYGLLHLCDKADSARPEDAIWRSWFTYRSWRFVMDKLRVNDEERRKVYRELFAGKIGRRISEDRGDYKISLFTYLYQRREAS